jgi:hypothetical protein
MSTPYDVIIAVREALKSSGKFQYIGLFPYDCKKAIAQAQNAQSDFATAIIEDGDESESEKLQLNGYDNIDFTISIYIFISQAKSTTIKKLHDIEAEVKTVMGASSTLSGLDGNICSQFLSVAKGNRTDNIDENNMIGYSDGLAGRKINYIINMQVSRSGAC